MPHLADPSDPWEEIDTACDGPPPDPHAEFADASEALMRVVELVFSGRGQGSLEQRLRSSFNRFVVLTSWIHPDLFNDASLATLADGLGVSRAALSKHQVQMTDRLGIHFRRQKSELARKHYSEAQLKNSHQRK